MDGSKTPAALSAFLDYLAEKGLVAKATAQARKVAAVKILAIVDRDEASDVTAINVDDLVDRFGRLHGKNYTPQSLNTYRSRLKSAIADFKSYSENPLSFRPSGHQRERRSETRISNISEDNRTKSSGDQLSEGVKSPSPQFASTILPIPIRADLTVFIQGLPFDLTSSEARKISGVINAMAAE